MSDKSAKMFQAVFENSPVGLVVVNKDTTLRDVNQYMFKVFNLAPKEIEGQMFGNVFNCSVISGRQQTCGESETCVQCPLRNGMTAVLRDGITLPDTVLDHNFIIKGTDQKKWFKISASRIEDEEEQFAIVSFSDITAQKEFEELLNNQLSLDMATGITNKYALLNILKQLAYGKEDMTVALIDFDNFKNVNDTYGHIIGDKVLKLFCSVASANTRKQDILGRFGGEEFVLVFPGASSGLLINALKRIAISFQESCEKELHVKTTFSVGAAEFSSAKIAEMDVDAIIAEADSNLYLSKSRGKNMITIGGFSLPFD